MATKKRWQTSQAIQKKIRDERARSVLLLQESESHAATVEQMKKVPPPWQEGQYEEFEWECGQREKKRKQAERIERVVIPKLIEKLQVFNTNLLSFCDDGDRSIPQ